MVVLERSQTPGCLGNPGVDEVKNPATRVMMLGIATIFRFIQMRGVK